MKKTCIIVDDDPYFIEEIKALIAQVSWIEVIYTTTLGLDAIEQITKRKIKADIVFLDIHLPDTTGLYVAQNVLAFADVIFVTFDEAYALNAIKYGVEYYIMKPLQENEFLLGVNKVKLKQDLIQRAAANEASLPFPFKIAGKGNKIFFETDDVLYIEKSKGDDFSIIHTEQGESYDSNSSMHELAEKLLTRNFFRIHRSYIINFKKIQRMDNDKVVLKGNVEVPMAGQFKLDFLNWFDL